MCICMMILSNFYDNAMKTPKVCVFYCVSLVLTNVR